MEVVLMLSAQNTPDLRPTAVGLTPLSNAQPFNQLKRTLSQDAESSMNGDADEANGRRSKRLKKGKHTHACTDAHSLQSRQSKDEVHPCFDLGVVFNECCASHWMVILANEQLADGAPTVAGSHMTQPRQSNARANLPTNSWC